MHATDSDELTAALRSIAPHGVDVGCRRISEEDIAALHPVEAAEVRNARPRRRSEFATGRALLRELIGIEVPIPRGSRGQPRLPSGVQGTLAHDADWVIAATSRSSRVAALGIDVETHTVLDPDEAAIIVGPDDDATDPLLTFVQKEAVYKAWSVLGGRLLEHHDVSVRSGSRDFRGIVTVDGSTFDGRHTTALNRRLALVVASSNG